MPFKIAVARKDLQTFDLKKLFIKKMGRDIAKKIDETMQYPGQIRVAVIRETRSTEYAK